MAKKAKKATRKPKARKRTRRPGYSTELIAAALQKCKGHLYLTAESIGCDYTTIWRRLKRSRQLRSVLKACRGKFLDVAESALQRAVMNGEGWAICFFLKTQGKKRGYIERVENEHSGRIEQRHSGAVRLVALRQEILEEPAYLEYCRSRAIDSDAGPVRPDGEPREVENGAASGPAGSGDNGHDRRNGRH